VEQHRTVVGMDIGFHGCLRNKRSLDVLYSNITIRKDDNQLQ